MRIGTVLTAAALASLVTSVPALAQEDACVRLSDIKQTKVLDRSTIVVTDRRDNQYTLHMGRACVGLDQFSERLTFRNNMRLRCLARGDLIDYNFAGQVDQITLRRGMSTQLSCTIQSISAGAPEEAEEAPS